MGWNEKTQHGLVSVDFGWTFHFWIFVFEFSVKAELWRQLCLANTMAVLYFGSENILGQSTWYAHEKAHRRLSLWKLTESLFQTVLTAQNMKKMSKYFFLLVAALFLDGFRLENTYLLKTLNSFQMEALLWSDGMQKIWFVFVKKKNPKNQKGWSAEKVEVFQARAKISQKYYIIT